jgi:hypothetical protein
MRPGSEVDHMLVPSAEFKVRGHMHLSPIRLYIVVLY